MFVGQYVWSGCLNHQNFYSMTCVGCEEIIVDYPHGYLQDGSLYFHHLDCPEAASKEKLRTIIKISKWWNREIYNTENVSVENEIPEVPKGFNHVCSVSGYDVLARKSDTGHQKLKKTFYKMVNVKPSWYVLGSLLFFVFALAVFVLSYHNP